MLRANGVASHVRRWCPSAAGCQPWRRAGGSLGIALLAGASLLPLTLTRTISMPVALADDADPLRGPQQNRDEVSEG
jgi:hypothetical protein